MFDEVRSNKIKSWILIFVFMILIGFLGAIIGILYGSIYFGLAIALLFGMIYSLIGFFSGNSMILAMTKAKPVTKKEYPYLYNTVEAVAISASIPTPKAYVIDDSALNAFATGRNHETASITVTTGLLKTMNRQELEGVVAHEMSHIKNYDIRVMMLAAVLIGIVTLLSDFLLRSFLWGGGRNRDSKGGNIGIILIVVGLVLAVLSPIIGEMIRLAISRKREFMADANGAILTRYPPGLASALRKIASDPDPLVDHANKATAHLFISTPFRNKKGFVSKLFMTHPPIEERIKRLEAM
ncbi:MAG: zinc metalloprotease HtpX [Nanoarchaeota archaeon]|nr:zinc metalloprotease HtpX [Nanoarchaeota archaeon]MBU1270459.1 zinc metalloprotease HtpX [Nanoarchaeota archaeon]MBU1605070.1 zinc metalloprotease HtpX [Nanoarchaeota archaeon]MBU2443106.1 zinc metalloprotease HtpX [Nanoarchaeota archaeon]